MASSSASLEASPVFTTYIQCCCCVEGEGGAREGAAVSCTAVADTGDGVDDVGVDDVDVVVDVSVAFVEVGRTVAVEL